jgi:hypothetical protein
VNARARQLVLKANAAFLGLFGAVSFFVLAARAAMPIKSASY